MIALVSDESEMDVRIGQAGQHRGAGAIDGGHVARDLADATDLGDATILDEHVEPTLGLTPGGIDEGDVADDGTARLVCGHVCSRGVCP